MAGAGMLTRSRGGSEDSCRGDRQVARVVDKPDSCDESRCDGDTGDLPVAPTGISNLRVLRGSACKILLRYGNDVKCDRPALQQEVRVR